MLLLQCHWICSPRGREKWCWRCWKLGHKILLTRWAFSQAKRFFQNKQEAGWPQTLFIKTSSLHFAQSPQSQPLLQSPTYNSRIKSPTYWEELEGIAEGSGMPYLDVWFLLTYIFGLLNYMLNYPSNKLCWSYALYTHFVVFFSIFNLQITPLNFS